MTTLLPVDQSAPDPTRRPPHSGGVNVWKRRRRQEGEGEGGRGEEGKGAGLGSSQEVVVRPKIVCSRNVADYRSKTVKKPSLCMKMMILINS